MTKITRIIKEARDQARLTALDFAQGIFDNFVELHGDRSFRDDGAVIWRYWDAKRSACNGGRYSKGSQFAGQSATKLWTAASGRLP